MTGSSEHKTFLARLEYQARKQPSKTAFTFLVDGEAMEEHISYKELVNWSKCIGQSLQEQFQPGDRAVLIFPPGLDFIKAFLGCLYAGVIAVPIYPPKAKRTKQQFETVLENAAPSVILTTKGFVKAEVLGDRLPVIYIEDISLDLNKQAEASHVTPETVALLQYTSGSTGVPKGVMISHENIMENQHLIQAAFGQNEESVIVGWLPFYHDMGLIGNILHPLFLGGRGVLMSPVHFLQKPIRWLKAISTYRGTVSGGPNFAYDLCANSISEDDRRALDLGSWKVAFNGAEKVRFDTLKRFGETFSESAFHVCALQPCYGMAEATLFIASKPLGTLPQSKRFELEQLQFHKTLEHAESLEKEIELTSCGAVAEGIELTIVDEHLRPVHDGQIGQILIQGKSVSTGYWGHSGNDRVSLDGFEGAFFQTGDLGIMEGNELYITGRLKDLIILNGLNYFPSDLEAFTTELSPALINNGCAAFSTDSDKGEQLIIVAEVDEKQLDDASALIQHVQLEISREFQVSPSEIVLIRRASLPKTTSGKVQRSKCRQLWQNGQLTVVARHEVESRSDLTIDQSIKASEENLERVRACVRLILKQDSLKDDENLFALGMNSIAIAQLSMALMDEFDTEVSLDWIFEHPTVAGIASYFETDHSPSDAAIQPSGTRAFYPLNPTQHGIWFDQKLREDSNSYHVPVCISLPNGLDLDRFREVFQTVVGELDIFRTAFRLHDYTPVQIVHPNSEAELGICDVSHHSETDYRKHISEFVCRRFDLEHAPLFRAEVLLGEEHAPVLVFAAHHLITDGTSILHLVRELLHRYDHPEENHSAPALQFKDMACWEAEQQPEQDEAAKSYWHQKLAGVREPLHLPYDAGFERNNHVGASYGMAVSTELTARLRTLARQQNTSVYAVMLTAFKLLLRNFTSQDQIIVGAPVSGRLRREVTSMCGPFLNAIILVDEIDQNSRVSEFIEQVGQSLQGALKFQHYPLHELAKELDLPRDVGHFPLTSVFFNGLNFIDDTLGAEAFGTFQGNLGLDMHLDLNCYIIETKDDIRVRLDYKRGLFRDSTIRRLLNEYLVILGLMVDNSNETVRMISSRSRQPMSGEERAQIMKQALGPSMPLPEHATVITMIEEQAALHPDKVVMHQGDRTLSYRELNERANAIAYTLLESGVKPGDFIPLLFTKCPELPITIMAVMKANAAFIPLDASWPEQRIQLLLDDIKPTILICEASLAISTQFPTLTINRNGTEQRAENPGLTPDQALPMYGFYTSGTTGMPKCAINHHKGVLNRFVHLNKSYGVRPDDCVLFTSSHVFDPCVWQMLWPLANGFPTVIPTTQRGLDFSEILQLIETHAVTITDFVPSVLQLFVDHLEASPSGREQVKSLRQLTVGGEAMNPAYIRKLKKLLPGIGVTNTYGATEVSIATVFYEVEDDFPIPIPIGTPADNTVAIILNENLELTPLGSEGEIFLGGFTVGSGYLNDPKRTAEAFVKNPFPELPGETLYKTGDIGYIGRDGNIYFQGRQDDQVKVNGMRVECGEIEQYLLGHSSIKQAAVSLVSDEGGKPRLIAHVATDDLEELAIRSYIKQGLPTYMMPDRVSIMDRLPLTANGKVDKKRLEEFINLSVSPEIESTVSTGTIGQLLKIVSDIAGINATASTHFFDDGGDSLKAMQLLTRVQRETEVLISLRDVFDFPVLRDLAKLIDQKRGESLEIIQKVSPRAHYDILEGQKGLWLLQQLAPEATAYNMPGAFSLQGHVDIPALEKAFQALVSMHEVLRTCFVLVGGVPMQTINEDVDFKLEYREIDNEETRKQLLSTTADTPFDLSVAPLFRALLVRDAADKHILQIVIHHIISDAWSMEVLWRQVIELYGEYLRGNGTPSLELAVQHKDISAWRRQRIESPKLQQQGAYWMEKMKDGALPLSLPTDRPRPAIRSFKGRSHRIQLPDDVANELRSFAKFGNATVFMTCLAFIKVLLHRYTGQRDLTVGTAIAGRNRQEMEDQIGFYVNTLPLRDQLAPNEPLASTLETIKNTALEAFENQDYPFQQLVNDLQLPVDATSNPLFNVLVVMLNTNLPRFSNRHSQLQVGDLTVSRLPMEHRTSKFDLTFNISDADGELSIEVEYDSELFFPERIKRLENHLLQLIRSGIAASNKEIGKLELIPETERQQLVLGMNDTERVWPGPATVTELLAEQARKTPDAVALIHGDLELTYRQIHQYSDRLANYLTTEYNAGPGSFIGVLMKRDKWLIISILAIIKTGAAYVPLDPAYPAERISMMASDCKMTVLLTDQVSAKVDLGIDVPFLLPHEQWEAIESAQAVQSVKRVNEDGLMYVIYTSGSTGRPKGVGIEHRNVVNLMQWAAEWYRPESLECVLASTSVCFDLSIFEIFLPLTRGHRLLLVDDLFGLREAPYRSHVTLINTVPSVLKSYLQLASLPEKVSVVNVAGEPLQKDLIDRIYAEPEVKQVVNLYGPSEATTYATVASIEATDARVTIGRPIANTQVYILDDDLQLLPQGIPGHLWIGGAGVARGYINHPEATAKRFLEIPSITDGRIYHTGDIARWTEDGQLEFLGRKDEQVKIRGFRIELGEIEHALLAHPQVQECVVVAYEDANGEKSLVAYHSSRVQLLTAELQSVLRESLPDYMIPPRMVQLDKLPRNASGKINKRVLPEPETVHEDGKAERIAPRNEIEENLTRIWGELLGIDPEQISVHHTFSELGGHSLKAIQIAARIGEEYAVNIKMSRIFQNPTIEELAKEIKRILWINKPQDSSEMDETIII